MGVYLDHIVLNARDIESMLDFYTRVIGLSGVRIAEFHKGEVPFPSVRINEHTIIDLLPPALWNLNGDAENERSVNLNHFCLAVEARTWELLLRRLDEAEVEIISGPMTLFGARGEGISVYIDDPDGNRLELRYYESG